jgi:hypothetical protein
MDDCMIRTIPKHRGQSFPLGPGSARRHPVQSELCLHPNPAPRPPTFLQRPCKEGTDRAFTKDALSPRIICHGPGVAFHVPNVDWPCPGPGGLAPGPSFQLQKDRNLILSPARGLHPSPSVQNLPIPVITNPHAGASDFLAYGLTPARTGQE